MSKSIPVREMGVGSRESGSGEGTISDSRFPISEGANAAIGEVVRLQGLIFDIDGTLVDSNDHHARCWIEAFDHFGKRFDYDVVRHQIGKGGDLLVPDLLNA